MATNADFDSLIQRIETATQTLENDVGSLGEATEAVEALVEQATTAVTTAQEAATEATNASDNAGASAQSAEESYQDAAQLVAQLEAAVVIEEAPIDGQVYGRKDGAWVIGGGSGGAGTVTSVNGVEPNESGEVTLTAASVGALEDSYEPSWDDVVAKPTFATVATSGLYSDLTGKPSIPTDNSQLSNGQGFIADAPTDGQQYARQSGGWSPVEAPAAEAVPYSIPTNVISVSSSYVDEWVDANPNMTYGISNLAGYVSGRYKDGEDFFVGATASVPKGKYHFTTSDFTTGELTGKEGYIEVVESENAENFVTAYVNPSSGTTEGQMYTWNNSDQVWLSVGGGGGASAGIPLIAQTPASQYYLDNNTVDSFTSNPFETVKIDLVGAYVGGRFVSGEGWFDESSSKINALPAGDYWFDNNTFSSGVLSSKRGWMQVRVAGAYTTVIANIVQNASSSADPTVYTYNYLSGWRAGFDGS